jgi:hypothetical protein
MEVETILKVTPGVYHGFTGEIQLHESSLIVGSIRNKEGFSYAIFLQMNDTIFDIAEIHFHMKAKDLLPDVVRDIVMHVAKHGPAHPHHRPTWSVPKPVDISDYEYAVTRRASKFIEEGEAPHEETNLPFFRLFRRVQTFEPKVVKAAPPPVAATTPKTRGETAREESPLPDGTLLPPFSPETYGQDPVERFDAWIRLNYGDGDAFDEVVLAAFGPVFHTAITPMFPGVTHGRVWCHKWLEIYFRGMGKHGAKDEPLDDTSPYKYSKYWLRCMSRIWMG